MNADMVTLAEPSETLGSDSQYSPVENAFMLAVMMVGLPGQIIAFGVVGMLV